MSSKKVQERTPKVSASPSSGYTRTPTERQPLPNRLVRLLSEARWLALAVLGVYFVLILASYHKLDPGWSHGTLVPQVHNLGGRAGAWIADVLLQLFGYIAFLLPVVLGAQDLPLRSAELRGDASRPLPDEVLCSPVPLVLRGLAAGWPMVRRVLPEAQCSIRRSIS